MASAHTQSSPLSVGSHFLPDHSPCHSTCWNSPKAGLQQDSESEVLQLQRCSPQGWWSHGSWRSEVLLCVREKTQGGCCILDLVRQQGCRGSLILLQTRSWTPYVRLLSYRVSCKKKQTNIDAHLVLNIRRTSVDSHFDHETYVYHEGKTVRKNVGIACFRIFGRNTSISFLRGHVFEDFARSWPEIKKRIKFIWVRNLETRTSSIFMRHCFLVFSSSIFRCSALRKNTNQYVYNYFFRVIKWAATIYLRVGECTELFSSGLSKTWEK